MVPPARRFQHLRGRPGLARGEVAEGHPYRHLRLGGEGQQPVEVRPRPDGGARLQRRASGAQQHLPAVRVPLQRPSQGLLRLHGPAGVFVQLRQRRQHLHVTRGPGGGLYQQALGARGVAPLRQRQPQALVPRGLPRQRQRQRVHHLHRFVRGTHLQMELGQDQIRLRLARLEGHRAPQVQAGPGEPLRLRENAAQEHVRGVVGGGAQHGPAQLALRARQIAQTGVLLPQPGEQQRVPIIRGQGEPQRVHRAPVVPGMVLQPRLEVVRVAGGGSVAAFVRGARVDGLPHGLRVHARPP